jgi:hypothetical protein
MINEEKMKENLKKEKMDLEKKYNRYSVGSIIILVAILISMVIISSELFLSSEFFGIWGYMFIGLFIISFFIFLGIIISFGKMNEKRRRINLLCRLIKNYKE